MGDFVDADDYWRISFSKERFGGRSVSNGGLKSNTVSYDYDKEFQMPVSSFKSFGFREMEVPTRKGNRNLNHEVLIDMEKMKEEKKRWRFSDDFRCEKGCEESAMNGYSSRKTSHGSNLLEKKQAGKEENSSKIQPDIKVQIKDNNLSGKNSFSYPRLDQIPVKKYKMKTFEDKRIKEIQMKTELHKESSYINRDFQGRNKTRTKAYSPRTECKIRAIEDMQKARMPLKMETKRQVMDGRTVFDSFAEVKDSLNPQQDFRNSMVEMMTEKEVRRSEDLEELLSCYLKLNCQEFHGMIIKVFRQVWFELNGIQ